MTALDTILLIGDIGGTNARFALAETDSVGYTRELLLNCSDHDTADEAIRYYLDAVSAPSPTTICLAAAGPVVEQEVRFTNNDWSISAADLQNKFATNSVHLLNDFEAIAYCIPFLTNTDLMAIGPIPESPQSSEQQTFGVLGPGTGLGTAGLRKFGNHFIPIVAEAGHVGFAPETGLQRDILNELRTQFDRVSVERLVSGPGLENLYWALCRLHGEPCTSLSAAEIFAKSSGGDNQIANETVETFFEILGQFAGDLALTLGATDGIFIAGGVAQRYPERLTNSRFRSGFESKGRHRTVMESIPTQLITHPQPGLLGAAYIALGSIQQCIDETCTPG